MIKDIKAAILVIVMVAAAAGSTGLFMLKELEKSNRIKAEELLWREKIVKKKTDKRLTSLSGEIDFIQAQLAERKKEATSLESELTGHRRQAESSYRKIAETDSKIISAKEKMGQLNTQIVELKTRVVNIVKDTLKLAEELSLLKETTDALREHLSQQLKEEGPGEITAKDSSLAESPQDWLEKARPAVLQPSLVGEVLIVNREFSFVIISLGENDGIKEGLVFDISHDDNILSQAKVETVRTNISAAALVNKETISQIRAGDKALIYPKPALQTAR